MLLVLPLRWFIASLIAAGIHELGHYGAVLLCKGRMNSVRIGAFHCVMNATDLTPWQEILCICAGPIAGFATLFLAPWMPVTAVCGFLQTVYNLLPVYPLDGGRLVRCMAALLRLSEKQLHTIEFVLMVALIIFVVLAGCQLGISVLLGGSLLLCRAISGKIPCKHR